ncbi:MAG: c-type cytochrome biosis protein CcmI [Pseudomonadota bacterium]
MLALALGLMAAVAVVALGWPLLRSRAEDAPRADYDRAVYRDQLAEIARDEERGLIGANEAAAARTEIERRALGALEGDPAREARGESPIGRKIALALVVALPAAAGIAYLLLGQPQLPGQPFASRPKAPETATAAKMPSAEALARMGEAIEAQLAENPDETQGWTLLLRLYRKLGRGPDAAAAYGRIAATVKDPARRAAMAIAWGEALVSVENGMVTPAARAAFDEALKLQPADPAARYYRGLALAQGGDRAGALGVWEDLARTAPRDAPWRAALDEQIARLRKDMGRR